MLTTIYFTFELWLSGYDIIYGCAEDACGAQTQTGINPEKIQFLKKVNFGVHGIKREEVSGDRNRNPAGGG